jgi:hypothetical protein
MRRSPFMVLVCLLFLIISVNSAWTEDFLDVVVQYPAGEEDASILSLAGSADETPSVRQASARPFYGERSQFPASPPTRVTKCKPEVCVPGTSCMPMPTMGCKLPMRMLGQWELAVQVFFARVDGKVKQTGYAGGIIPASDIDLTGDLGVPSNGVFLEYSARYQLAPHWAVYYSIMPIELEGNNTLDRDLFYGRLWLPAGTRVHTRWDFTYQRLGLLYQPIVNCNASVSVFGGWTYNEQYTQVFNYVCHGHCSTISRTRHMVNSGIEIQKCLMTKCTGATMSCDSRVGFNYLDGTFGVDVQTGVRLSVPMGANRWGYARGGYRYLNLSENRTDMTLDVNLSGGFVEAGLIF